MTKIILNAAIVSAFLVPFAGEAGAKKSYLYNGNSFFDVHRCKTWSNQETGKTTVRYLLKKGDTHWVKAKPGSVCLETAKRDRYPKS